MSSRIFGDARARARAAREGQSRTLVVARTRWYGGRCGAAVPQFAERLGRSGGLVGLDVDVVAVGVQWLAGARVWQGKL